MTWFHSHWQVLKHLWRVTFIYWVKYQTPLWILGFRRLVSCSLDSIFLFQTLALVLLCFINRLAIFIMPYIHMLISPESSIGQPCRLVQAGSGQKGDYSSCFSAHTSGLWLLSNSCDLSWESCVCCMSVHAHVVSVYTCVLVKATRCVIAWFHARSNSSRLTSWSVSSSYVLISNQ